MNASKLELWWGSPATAQAYRADTLSDADKLRAGGRTAPKSKRDWEVSRALMFAARAAAEDDTEPATATAPTQSSLSHRQGHAIYTVAGGAERIGVDLEAWLPRDIMSLAGWCCTEVELAFLTALAEPRRSEFFYTLWTIKESFVKAADLDFPADMRRHGLGHVDVNVCERDPALFGLPLVTSLPGTWHAASYCLDEKWIASVVWQSTISARAVHEIDWRPGPHAHIPVVRGLGRWTTI